MKQYEYAEKPDAKEDFERTMTPLFRAPKPEKGKAAKKSSKAASARKSKSSDKLVPAQNEDADIPGYMAGKVKVVGDIVGPVIPLEDWEGE